MKIYSICVSAGFITFGFIINVYFGFIILLSFLPVLQTIVRKEDNEPINAIYTKKDFLTYNEKLFYRKLLPLHNEYIIIPQLLLLIELNDKSHIQRNRKIRDRKVKNILKECNIPL